MKQSLGAKTLLYPTPVLVIGSYDVSGKPNIMTAAWAGVCCSDPPSVAVSLRAATYSHGNITHSQAFTVNVPSVAQVKPADYAGLRSGRDTDKFADLGLTAVKSQVVNAPYVDEFALILECQVTHVHDLGLHTQFVGEIRDVLADEHILDNNGLPDMTKVAPLIFSTGDQGYYCVGERIAQAFSIGEET